MAYVPSSSEVIEFLVLVHVLELTWSYETCPQAVPSCSVREAEASDLECIHHAIVSVSRVIYFEGQDRKWLQIFLTESLYSILSEWPLLLQKWRIREENGWGSTLNRPIVHGYHWVWRPPQESLFERPIFASSVLQSCRLLYH